MQACVAIGLDATRSRFGPHDEERHLGDLVHVVVADVRDLLLQARQLPHTTPQLLDFEVMELAGRVVPSGDARVAFGDALAGLFTQRRSDGMCVLIEELGLFDSS